MRAEATDVDVDLLQQLQAELDTLRRELDHQQRLAMIGTLAAGAVHEINNLLTPALAYAQLAQCQPELTDKAIRQCVAAIGSASRISETLMGFAGPSDELAIANVHEAVAAAMTCLGRDPSKDGIKVIMDVPGDLHFRISPLSLQQILLNLLINAINALRHRPAGEIRINARSGSITVRDNGPGIPSQVRETLFQPFSVSRETGGHGLGLWVCLRLVEAAEGTIAVETGDQGTIFTITLPAA